MTLLSTKVLFFFAVCSGDSYSGSAAVAGSTYAAEYLLGILVRLCVCSAGVGCHAIGITTLAETHSRCIHG
jgi:hypothetical protein